MTWLDIDSPITLSLLGAFSPSKLAFIAQSYKLCQEIVFNYFHCPYHAVCKAVHAQVSYALS
jgi:hypothetical protein